MDNSVTFGICTYNRKEIVELSAKSLMRINNIEKINVRIYDDCSTEYDIDYLWKLFPTAVSVKRAKMNQGADKNTSSMYEDFLLSGDEWLFNADSDLIYSSKIVDLIQRIQKDGKGIISLFNCINHKTLSDVGKYVEKDSLGAAGCLLRRDIVEMILHEIKNREAKFDVNFSKLLKRKGFDLLATSNSYVQHIGVSGYNSRDINFDYGNGFMVEDEVNAQIIEKTFEKYISSVNEYRKTKKWRIYYFIISVPRRVNKILGIVKARIHRE